MGISHQKGEENAEDYFLAGKSLPWWAIGASLIAANISAEQFIGMSGSGFAVGLAIASYEWMAAITLLLVGKFSSLFSLKKNSIPFPNLLKNAIPVNLKPSWPVFGLVSTFL